ncbi:hypothetical protein N7537_010700 [Penicillium hordei]|uniref:Uncharacterized protein n=1 Tax=Penicillium hordei TaxID=40994 RepID=A0AAD6DKG5_9EURO|nr:uncharacterized protein N7537_010700 [Penicillium hordei]KAJ5588022.1 hypothetical protein N7537_010700 [Penicillium hordei]
MSSTNFRLESFRPWNTFQDKAQPLRDPPGTSRYPSPISISTTPPSIISAIRATALPTLVTTNGAVGLESSLTSRSIGIEE